MKIFSYNVYINGDDERVIYETNDVNSAIKNYMEYIEKGYPCSIISGFTGEVFVSNDGMDWITDEWALMIKGWIMDQLWG